jgi:excisionase family DNA binding protein
MLEKRYYSVEEAAHTLGITPGEVNLLRERHELHGYRDGAAWKFKVEDVDALAKQRRLQEKLASAEVGEDTGDVLLSEVALGGSDAGSSGTVIGASEKGPHDSDLRLADSELKLGDEKAPAAPGSGAGKAAAAAGAGELGMSLEQDIILDESISLDDEPQAPPVRKPAGDSAVELAAEGKKLDDDNVVLGGSGTGSDITIGGDSGISLVDPTDSGLSLEEPLELDRAEDESLELGEDDMLTFSEEADTDAPTQLRADEDFMLTPMEEAPEEESESGSQVIALDTEPAPESAPTMLAPGRAPAAAAMLDEDFSAAGDAGLAAGMPVGGPLTAAQPGLAEAASVAAPVTEAFQEAPYTGLNILALSVCTLLLILGGMMAYDLMRNMWSWGGPYTVNSQLMDLIVPK